MTAPPAKPVDEIKSAHQQIQVNDSLSHRDRWRKITDIHDTYPQIWQHLDRARDVLVKRGGNTLRYDELRPKARRATTIATAPARTLPQGMTLPTGRTFPQGRTRAG